MNPILLMACILGSFAPVVQAGDWGRVTSSRGVYWTILCMEMRGAGAAGDAERVAESLRNTRGIEKRKVVVEHDVNGSRIYYGKYLRKPDKSTGQFLIPADMQRDAALIKDLSGNEGGRFFLDSRPVPVPTPDPGPPEWRLKNCPGTFSLRIAIFFDEPDFYKRKDAAVEYCKELREKGYDAYYRHTEFVSEVFVGSFGPDARIKGRKFGVVAYFNSAEVQALQLKEKGRFQYELWNMKVRTMKPGDDKRGSYAGSIGNDRRVVYLSRLFPVREETEDDFYDY
ncbi:MAG: hypothetical protein H6817_07130 [Phycisphaerales bacterium]|nr:hypothetical protein [Phycisphaerales bacterium]